MARGGRLGFDAHGRLGYVTGVVNRAAQAFERVLFRVTRGNIYLRSAVINAQVRPERRARLQVGLHRLLLGHALAGQGRRLHAFGAKRCRTLPRTRTPRDPSPLARPASAPDVPPTVRARRAAHGPHPPRLPPPQVQLPRAVRDAQQPLAEVQTRIDDLQHVIETSVAHRNDKLRTFARQISAWRTFVPAEGRLPRAQHVELRHHAQVPDRRGLVPRLALRGDQRAALGRRDLGRVGAVDRQRDRHGGEAADLLPHQQVHRRVPGHAAPPRPSPNKPSPSAAPAPAQQRRAARTTARTNRWGAAWATSTGTACHGTVINPAAFTIITTPSSSALFDVGHGMLILIFAPLHLQREEVLRDGRRGHRRRDRLPWSGRYVLLLMALFAIYCGFIYNDTFGLMVDLFSTSYDMASEGESRPRKAGAVYAFGMDPAWHRTTRCAARRSSRHAAAPHPEGTCVPHGPAMGGIRLRAARPGQLTRASPWSAALVLELVQDEDVDHPRRAPDELGLFCSLLNALHFRNAIDVWCEFVPQAIFMLSIFGYLSFAIFLKWSTDWVAIGEPPPSLITLLIEFFMRGRASSRASSTTARATSRRGCCCSCLSRCRGCSSPSR